MAKAPLRFFVNLPIEPNMMRFRLYWGEPEARPTQSHQLSR
jgi:hypothetical protein